MKKTKNVILISNLLLCGLISLIVFLTVDKARLDTITFWIAFAFAVPVNLAAALIAYAKVGKNETDDMATMPAKGYLSLVFGIVYLITGLIFMYAPIKGLTAIIITEAVITVLYLICALSVGAAASATTERAKKETQKVLYIRMLATHVEECVYKAKERETRNALDRYAENIRYSDPMSHPSLSEMETELFKWIADIASLLSTGEEEEARELIQRSEDLLKKRNGRCMMLK